jgi:hypothetical protein
MSVSTIVHNPQCLARPFIQRPFPRQCLFLCYFLLSPPRSSGGLTLTLKIERSRFRMPTGRRPHLHPPIPASPPWNGILSTEHRMPLTYQTTQFRPPGGRSGGPGTLQPRVLNLCLRMCHITSRRPFTRKNNRGPCNGGRRTRRIRRRRAERLALRRRRGPARHSTTRTMGRWRCGTDAQ